jgi:hypothetical protein
VAKVEEFAVEIAQAIADYTENVAAAIEDEVDETSKAIVEEIRANSPRDTGEYAKGWTRRKGRTPGSISYTIHNRSKPQLTHLLEHGHAKRGGGRVEGRPHIGPAVDKHIPAMERRIEQIIERGG